ncbi:DUF1289 domain-containing protein [Alsobacter soli]|uniref:DUF1289 domain-containing protein n=1 Tax=Alsobacter soli TaxID=2109933 RepID=A0A2T1HQH0_9HYPH|nr:DUF1289 domain-containing protein [Alsobacter soli]PSC03901.1 DUF1289 domain-containing protein [Alsobacter soli]
MQITESPCIQVCVIDPTAGLCVGCGRTIDEISRWVDMTSAQRRAIMDALPARLAAADLPPRPVPTRTGRRRQRVRS